MNTHTDPDAARIVLIDGRHHWLYPDGTILRVIAGASDDSDPFAGLGDPDPGPDPDPDAPANEPDKGPDPVAELARLQAENAKLLAISRKHETRAKENFEAKQKLEKLENAGKTEAERQAATIAELQKQYRDARVEALRLRVASEKGLSNEQAKFLPDLDDEVDMIAAAEELLEAFGAADKGSPPTRQPKSTLTNPLGDDDAAAKREALLNSMLGKAAL